MNYYELETPQYFPNSEKSLSAERNFTYIKSFLFAIDRLIAVPTAQGAHGSSVIYVWSL